MEDDRHELISFHLTVRLCVVSRQMRAIWRSSRKFVCKIIRRVIIFVVLFWLGHLTRGD